MARYRFMVRRQKCVYCEKRAIAYRLEPDGGKIFLCEDHMPAGEAPHHPETGAAARETRSR